MLVEYVIALLLLSVCVAGMLQGQQQASRTIIMGVNAIQQLQLCHDNSCRV